MGRWLVAGEGKGFLGDQPQNGKGRVVAGQEMGKFFLNENI